MSQFVCKTILNPLSANPAKWSKTLKQFRKTNSQFRNFIRTF